MKATNLPETPLTQMHWNVGNCFRLLSVLILFVCVLQMVMMLSHYWWRIIPLRQEIGKTVVAPPVVWTFAYHIVVALIAGFMAIGLGQGIYYDSHPTIFTYVGPPLFLALTIIVSKFLTFYSRTLNDWDHLRFKR